MKTPHQFPRPAWLLPQSHDWPEDFAHENGQYFCNCIDCGGGFIGYKRRHVCQACAGNRADAWKRMTPEEQQAAQEEARKAIEVWNKQPHPAPTEG